MNKTIEEIKETNTQQSTSELYDLLSLYESYLVKSGLRVDDSELNYDLLSKYRNEIVNKISQIEAEELQTLKQTYVEEVSLLDYLSEPILHEDKYYFLQVSKTRCWYQDLEGNVLEFTDTDGVWTAFVKSGDTLKVAMERQKEYLNSEWVRPLWEQKDTYKQTLEKGKR
jgi:hypothetical protein